MKSGFKWVLGILSLGGLIGFASNKKAEKIGEVSKTEVGPQVEKAKNEELKRESNDVDKNNSKSVSEKEDKKVFNVGDLISYDEKYVSITSVQRNYNPSNSFEKPKDGKEYLRLHISLENKSKSNIDISSLNFKVRDGNGVIHSSSYLSDDDHLGVWTMTELAPNGKISGTLTFEVPKGDNNVVIQYNPSFWSNKGIEIKI